MKNTQALQIIRSLANGLDPLTQRELPPGTPFEQPAVIRALFAATRALEAAAALEVLEASAPAPSASTASHDPLATPAREDLVPPPATQEASVGSAPAPVATSASVSTFASWEERPANAGKAWGRDEDSRLCDGFDRGVSLDVLAQIHARTLASIQSRLVKLGKMAPPENSAAAST